MSGNAGQGNTDGGAASGSPWRRIEAGVAALVLVLALAGCGGAGPRGGTPATVQPPPVCQADVAPPFKPETLPGRASLQGALAPPCPAGCKARSTWPSRACRPPR